MAVLSNLPARLATAATAVAAIAPRPNRWVLPKADDPRIRFALFLTLYVASGCTVLRFNRGPMQIVLKVSSACLFDMALHYALRGRRLLVPLSAAITGLSLALLLNYSHNYYLLFLPVYFSIGSKYLLTYQGRHVFNPSVFGIALSLLLGGDLIMTSPAYQWGGTWAMAMFIATGALILFVFKVRRNVLILSF
jgi:Na+-transporting NADH:ubiquinone oxidoreductase subunit NqrB